MLISGMLRRAAHGFPDKLALRDNGASLTWGELETRVSRIAGGLEGLGLKRGDRVAVLDQNGMAFHDAYLALTWAGMAMVCINIRWSPGEIADAINDSGARALLVGPSFLELAPSIQASCPALELLIATEDGKGHASWAALAREPNGVPAADAGPGDLAYILFTGGTTGRSKGVQISHLAFFSAALMRLHTGDFTHDSVIGLSLPLFHVSGAAFVGANLAAASQLELLPSFEPVTAMESVERAAVTHVGWVPTMLSMVLNHRDFAAHDLTSLRRVFYGASPMAPSLLRQAMESLPSARFVQYYGMTETCAGGTWLGAQDHDPGEVERLGSIGRTVPGMELEIRRMDDSHDVAAIDEAGEVWMRGPMVTTGYWQRPDATRVALTADGWLRTGDVGRRDAHGFVYLVDRLKDMIITGGENVYSTEVENVISAMPAVLECAVVGLPDEQWGEVVCAHIHLRDAAEVSEKAIQDHCRQHLGGYKIPRRIFFSEAPLPKTPAGKILKTELRRHGDAAAIASAEAQ